MSYNDTVSQIGYQYFLIYAIVLSADDPFLLPPAFAGQQLGPTVSFGPGGNPVQPLGRSAATGRATGRRQPVARSAMLLSPFGRTSTIARIPAP